MPKIFKRGFYGGKFLPFHKGHKYCIEVMASECVEAVVIFFINSEEEEEIMKNGSLTAGYLNTEKRREEIKKECSKYGNVRYVELDCRVMHREAILNGSDPWDSETVHVQNAVGEFQAVYSSEPGYDAYFKRSYPHAVHRLVDPPRIHVPISGTMIRGMSAEEADRWF